VALLLKIIILCEAYHFVSIMLLFLFGFEFAIFNFRKSCNSFFGVVEPFLVKLTERLVQLFRRKSLVSLSKTNPIFFVKATPSVVKLVKAIILARRMSFFGKSYRKFR